VGTLADDSLAGDFAPTRPGDLLRTGREPRGLGGDRLADRLRRQLALLPLWPRTWHRDAHRVDRLEWRRAVHVRRERNGVHAGREQQLHRDAGLCARRRRLTDADVLRARLVDAPLRHAV